MGTKLIDELAAILAAVVGLAIVAVLVSQNSSTSNVITSGGKAFASILGAAVKPAAGNGLSI